MNSVQIHSSNRARVCLMILATALVTGLLLLDISQQYLYPVIVLLLFSIFAIYRSVIGISRQTVKISFINKNQWRWIDQSGTILVIDEVRAAYVSSQLVTAQIKIAGKFKSLFIFTDAINREDHWLLRCQLTRGIVPTPISD